MPARSVDLQMFLDAAATAFAGRASDTRAAASISHCFAEMARAVETAPEPGSRLPVCDSYLARATDAARAASPDLARLADTFLRIEPALIWRKRAGTLAGANDRFDAGHANAMIVGPGGLERRSDVWLGVSLLAPDVRYPDHTHPPEETYLVLSRGEFSQADGAWFEPGPGGSFYNPPGILHAMRSGPEPLFAFWLLRPGPQPTA